MVGMVYAIVGTALVVLWKSSKVLNFAQGALTMGAALVFFHLIYDRGIPKWSAILLVIAGAIILALGIERFAMRRLMGRPIWAPILMLLGVATLVRGAVFLAFSASVIIPKPGNHLLPIGFLHLDSILISKSYLTACAISAGLFIGLILFFRYTKLGLGLRALAEDHQVAQSLGVKVKRLLPLVWIIVGLLSAVTGIIMGSIYPISGDLETFVWLALPVMLLGGMESFSGLLLAGPMIGIAQLMCAYYLVPILGNGIEVVVPYLLMFIVVLVRPWGIFGLRKIERI
jgi:branched-chain amino acid transport system permease protein